MPTTKTTETTTTKWLPQNTLEERIITDGEVFDYFSSFGALITIDEIHRKSGIVFPRVDFEVEGLSPLEMFNRFHSIIQTIINSDTSVLTEKGYSEAIIRMKPADKSYDPSCSM